jgi:predicted DNA-binding antitoxin AbrB/MazE fold protein
MSQRLRATYRSGIFVPESPCDLPEGAAVDLTVHGLALLPPEVTDPEERQRILAGMIERMQKNPIPPEAPPLDRESLHERR